MCVSELMIALGQADLAGKFSYGAPALMRSLSHQLHYALDRTIPHVAKAVKRPPMQLWTPRDLAEVQEEVRGQYNRHLQMCKAVAHLLDDSPSELLPTRTEVALLVRTLTHLTYSTVWRLATICKGA